MKAAPHGATPRHIADRTIHFTNDYSIFKIMPGNRGIDQNRVQKIMDSIEQVGYIPVPIVVNEDHCIIDGQGRWMALQKLGLSIAYMVVDGLDINDCIAMNVSGTAWRDIDYVNSYADQGNENYERLRKLLYSNEFSWAKLTNVLMATTGKPQCSDSLRSGDIVITESRMNYASALLNYAGSTRGFFNKVGSLSKMLNAIMFAAQVDGVDQDRLLEVIERDGSKAVSLLDIDSCLAWLTESYNYKRRFRDGAEKIRFDNEYEDAIRSSKSWYAAKWGWDDSSQQVDEDSIVYQDRLSI